MRVTYLLSNTAGIGLIALRKSAIGSRSLSSSTPAFFAAVYASSGIGSHAPNTMSSSDASGTKSLMNGERFSVRFPRRMVAICVSEPIGLEWPRRMLSTPAMNVVATAPRPGVRMPSVPLAGRMVVEANVILLSRLMAGTCPGTAPQPEGFFSGERDRRFAGPRVGLPIHEVHALHDRDPGSDREEDDDGTEYGALEREAKEGLRRGEKHDALGPLQHPDLRVQPE